MKTICYTSCLTGNEIFTARHNAAFDHVHVVDTNLIGDHCRIGPVDRLWPGQEHTSILKLIDMRGHDLRVCKTCGFNKRSTCRVRVWAPASQRLLLSKHMHRWKYKGALTQSIAILHRHLSRQGRSMRCNKPQQGHSVLLRQCNEDHLLHLMPYWERDIHGAAQCSI